MSAPIYLYRHNWPGCRSPFAASLMPVYIGMMAPASAQWRVRTPTGWAQPLAFSHDPAYCPDCRSAMLPFPSRVALLKVMP